MVLSNSTPHAFYEDGAPLELEQSLVGLYQCVFCVREHFERPGGEKVEAFLLGTVAAPIHILFYAVSGREVTVLNELFSIGSGELHIFAHAIFQKYPKVKVINLNRLSSRVEKVGYPSRVWNSSCDIVVELPDTLEEYRSKLGKHTKSNMNNYSNKLRKEQKDFSFSVAAGAEIDPDVVSKIIEMNRSRMDSKRVQSAFDSALEEKTQTLARKYGLVATISVNGQLAAGTVCYEVGGHCYADIISHDPAYNRYSIGQVCIYLTIKALIERGRSAFHMLWGENDYKFRFLGVKRDIHFVSVYRSPAHKRLSALTQAGRFRYAVMARELCGQYARAARGMLVRSQK